MFGIVVRRAGAMERVLTAVRIHVDQSCRRAGPVITPGGRTLAPTACNTAEAAAMASVLAMI